MNWNLLSLSSFILYLYIFPPFLSFGAFRLGGIESVDNAVEPRKSAQASITRSKADRDSSSCDATQERITLSAWRRDSLLRDVRCKRPSRESYARRRRKWAFHVDRASPSPRAIAKSDFANFSFARVISSHESGNFPLVARDERSREKERDECWRWGFGLVWHGGERAKWRRGGRHVGDLLRRRQQTRETSIIIRGFWADWSRCSFYAPSRLIAIYIINEYRWRIS